MPRGTAAPRRPRSTAAAAGARRRFQTSSRTQRTRIALDSRGLREVSSVIVTGASSSIGRGILLGFATERAKVVAAQRDEEAGGRAVAEANRLGGEAICVRTDVTDLASVEAMVAAALDRFGKIDVLVNNAGGIPGEAKFIDKSRQDWEKEIQLNYWGVINCTRAVLDDMISHRWGRIVNITSGSAVNGAGAVDHAVYAGTKSGVNGLTRALAWELGRYNITVNAASPGWIVVSFFLLVIPRRARGGLLARRCGFPEPTGTTALFGSPSGKETVWLRSSQLRPPLRILRALNARTKGGTPCRRRAAPRCSPTESLVMQSSSSRSST
ncbi:MAG: SDR family oxidoreductase [Deltaproteobacteria bacterium]|nr:MAG: SDR family oxidoreductase [Deltaproteobacteria bacterium]